MSAEGKHFSFQRKSVSREQELTLSLSVRYPRLVRVVPAHYFLNLHLGVEEWSHGDIFLLQRFLLICTSCAPRSVELVGINPSVKWYLPSAGKGEFALNKYLKKVGIKSPVVDAVISGGQKFCVGSVSLALVRREFCAVSLDQPWWGSRVWAW